MKTVDEIIIVADKKRKDVALPFQTQDLVLLKKHRRIIYANFGEWIFSDGFYKITVESSFFGLVKKLTLIKLDMPV